MEPPGTVNRTLALALGVSLLLGPLLGFAVARVTDDDEIVGAGARGDEATVTTAADAELEPGMGRLVLVRDVGAIRARVYELRYGPYDDGNPFWEAPGWCSVDGSLTVEVSTPELVGIDSLEYDAGPDAGTTSHASLLGTMEGRPLWVAMVRDDAATSVSVRFPDGTVDSMAPVDGIAVLMAAAPAGTEATDDGPSFTATVVSPAGTREETVRPWWSRAEPYPGDDPACQPPPPALPPPGEQPDDPAVARAAIEAAYVGLYSSVGDPSGRVHLEDADALADVFAQLEEQGLPIPEGTPIRPEVRELVFDRPDHAWLRFDLVVESISTFRDRIGEAVVVDGTWRVANATICQDLALAGVQC